MKENNAPGGERRLQYYGARYYDPRLAQFTTPDSLLPDVYDPQQLNRYAYVLNNPYAYTDPDGRFAKLVTGALISIANDLLFNNGDIGAGRALVFGLTAKASNRIISSNLNRLERISPFLTQKPLTQVRVAGRSIAQLTGIEGPAYAEVVASFLGNPYGFIPNAVSLHTDSLLNDFIDTDPLFEFNPITNTFSPGAIPASLGIVDPNVVYQYVHPAADTNDGMTASRSGYVSRYYPSDRYSYDEYKTASETCLCSLAY